MQFLTQIFQNKIDKFLSTQTSVNPKNSPQILLNILKSKSECEYLKKKLKSKTSDIYKLFKRLTICSLLLVYSNKFYDMMADIPVVFSGNKWVDQEFLEPYYMFLKKIALSNQMYQNTKRACPMFPGKNMQMLFYNIGLLKIVFRIVAKMPLLGRYYKPKNDHIVSTFITTIAVQAQKIYISFKQILNHMIQTPKLHIPNHSDELIMQSILRDELPYINEQMKKLFLDKYFYPLGKGIGIKLFKPQQQSQASQKTIMGIINNHENTNRQRHKNQLEITLFPGQGKVNLRFYQQTLLSNMKLGTYDDQEVLQVVQDIAVDQQPQISIQNRFEHKPQGKLKINQNQIETGIERYGEVSQNI